MSVCDRNVSSGNRGMICSSLASRRFTVAALLLLTCLAAAGRPATALGADPGWQFTPQPLDRIPAGTVITDDGADGWSDRILFVKGALGAGDVSAASGMVKRYASLFNLVYLANVREDAKEGYVLDKVAVGFSTPIRGKNVIVTADTQDRLGADLGFIGGSVLSGNEEALVEVQRNARYSKGMLIDAPTLMQHEGKHQRLLVRFFIWVSPKGEVGTVVWRLGRGAEKGYSFIDKTFQFLPPNMVEERVMHVDGKEFTLGLPSKKAFAVVSIPQGQSYPVTEKLTRAGALATYGKESLVELATSLAEAMSE